jgi:hypothetical protein
MAYNPLFWRVATPPTLHLERSEMCQSALRRSILYMSHGNHLEYEYVFFFFPVPVCAITASEVPGGNLGFYESF